MNPNQLEHDEPIAGVIPAEFVIELTELINKHSLENLCDTPDNILAMNLAEHLSIFAKGVNQREAWFGRIKQPVEAPFTKW